MVESHLLEYGTSPLMVEVKQSWAEVNWRDNSNESGWFLIDRINVVMLGFCFVLFETGSQYVALPGCPITRGVDQAGPELKDPLVSAFTVLELKACTTTSGYAEILNFSKIADFSKHKNGYQASKFAPISE